MIEFIHTADWHLGNSFSHFSPEMRKKLNDARFLTVESIFIYAKNKNIPLILCAGDNIDNGQLADPSHLDRLIRMVAKYPNIKLILIAGNHDPLMANSVYYRYDKNLFPDNFHLVTDNEVISLPDSGLVIFAGSIKEKNGDYNPLNWIDPADFDDNRIHIGLVHGSIRNERFANDAFPIEPDFAIQKKLNYLALGDWHSFNKINERTYYPGVPEPLQFGDQGYPLRVTVAKPGAAPTVEKITGVQQYFWLEIEKTISDDNFPTFQTEFSSIGLKEIRKIKLSGFLAPGNYKIYKDLLRLHRSQYYSIIDQVGIHPDDEELLKMADGSMRDLVNQLLVLKKSNEEIPEDIFNRIVPFNQENVEKAAESITREEILDRALLKMYQMFGSQ